MKKKSRKGMFYKLWNLGSRSRYKKIRGSFFHQWVVCTAIMVQQLLTKTPQVHPAWMWISRTQSVASILSLRWFLGSPTSPTLSLEPPQHTQLPSHWPEFYLVTVWKLVLNWEILVPGKLLCSTEKLVFFKKKKGGKWMLVGSLQWAPQFYIFYSYLLPH